MFKKNTNKEFYVYVYLNPLSEEKIYNYQEKYKFNYEPFYVGKGKGGRFKDHIKNQEGSEEKNLLIKKIIDHKKDPIIIKIKENLEENEAFDLEKELIRVIGRSNLGEGPLVNIQPGGEGFSGWIITENWREKNKQGLVKRWSKPENRKKQSESIKKAFDNPITKEKLSKSMKNEWSDPEKRKRRVEIQQLPHVKQKKSITSIEKLSKTWILVSPNGERFTTNRFGKFCTDNNLCTNSLHAVANFKKISYKGWICFKEGKEEETLKKIEELKEIKKMNKIKQNLSQIGKKIHNEDSKKRIGNASKGNTYGLGYKHKKEDIEVIRNSSLEMWKKRKD